MTVKTWNKQALDGLVKGGKTGTYSLGYNSLSFRVAKTGASWVWQARVDGKPRTFVVGHYPNVSLVRAREIATEMVALRDTKQHKKLESYRLGSKTKGTTKPTRAKSADGVMIVKDAWSMYIEEL